MNTMYDSDEWVAETKRGRRVFYYDYSFFGSEFKGWKLLKMVTMQQCGDTVHRVYLWQSTGNPNNELIRIDVIERPQWRLALESLREQLMEHTRQHIPKGVEELAKLGDVVYAHPDPQTDIAGAILFTSGNLCILVSSAGERDVDVTDFAVAIGRALAEPLPARKLAGAKLQVPRGRMAAVKANKARVLIRNLQRATPRRGWLKVTVPDGELVRKNNALLYTSPEGGKKSIGTFLVTPKST